MRLALMWVTGLGVVALAVYTIWSSLGGGAGRPGAGGGGPSMLAGAPVASYQIARLGGGLDGVTPYYGSVVIVNLWASWCAPCRSETPALERLYEADHARGLVILGIDQGESAEAAGAFARELKLTYPILLDSDQQYGRAYASVGLPTSIFVDRTGHIVLGHDGELTFDEMRKIVDPLIAKR